MKGILGIFIFSIAGLTLLAYISKENTNSWIVIPLFILAGVGLELIISDRINTKIEKLKEELKDEFER